MQNAVPLTTKSHTLQTRISKELDFQVTLTFTHIQFFVYFITSMPTSVSNQKINMNSTMRQKVMMGGANNYYSV